jgi:hypothetical protein
MKRLTPFGLAGAFRGWHEAIMNQFWTEELGHFSLELLQL